MRKTALSNYICMFISSQNIPLIFTFLFFLPAFSQEKVIHAPHASIDCGKKINQRVLLFQTSKCSTPSEYLHV